MFEIVDGRTRDDEWTTDDVVIGVLLAYWWAIGSGES